MSLIYAVTDEKEGYFVSDTLLSFDNKNLMKKSTSPIEVYHGLKVHILNPSICIALAGEYQLGLDVIVEFSNKLKIVEKETTHSDLLQKLIAIYGGICLEKNKQFNVCEFLVMMRTSDGIRLTKIENNQIKHCKEAYIGQDSSQLESLICPYPRLDRAYVKHEDGRETLEVSKTSNVRYKVMEVTHAMEELSDLKKDLTIGVIYGGAVRVGVNKWNGFAYCPQAINTPNYIQGNEDTTKLLTSSYPTYGVGIFYSPSQVGYVFAACNVKHCHKINATNIETFIEIAKNKYQLELVDGTW